MSGIYANVQRKLEIGWQSEEQWSAKVCGTLVEAGYFDAGKEEQKPAIFAAVMKKLLKK